jgi:hypothetical protein
MDTKSEGNRALSEPDTTTQFVLVRNPAKTDSEPATAGASSGVTSAAVVVSTYRLDDMSAVPIAPHVGHEVEISGTVIDEERHESTGGAAKATPPKVVVSALTMIASQCASEP